MKGNAMRAFQMTESADLPGRIRAYLPVLAVLVFGFLIGRNIVRANAYFWLIIAAIPVSLVLLKNSKLGILLITVSVFFGDWLYGAGLIPAQLTWLPETVILVYSLKTIVIRKRFVSTPLDFPIVMFLVIAVCSMILNSTSPFALFLALRLDMKFILMFYLLINLDLDEQFFRLMFKVVTFLLVIQVPVAFLKYLRFGQMESAIGTYAYFGGGISTVLPLFAISFFLGLYLTGGGQKYRRQYLLYILGYLIFPIFAGKKGFIVFGILLSGFLVWQAGRENLHKFIPVGMILLPGLLASLYFVPGLRPALSNPRYLWDFSISYETVRSERGEAGGRLVAIGDTFNAAKKDAVHFLVGWGPGSTIKSFFSSYSAFAQEKLPIRIYYGFTHLVSTVIEYGYLGFLFYFLIPLYVLFKANRYFYKNVANPFWKAASFGFGGILFSVFSIGIFYMDLLRADVIGFLFWFFAAAIIVMARKFQTA